MNLREDIILVTNLTKQYGPLVAVNNISFKVQKGEIFAFVGPNGAGKSTTIKILITLLEPTRGDGVIGGFSVIKQSSEVRRIIGYVPQMISVDGTLSALENLKLMAKLYDIPRKDRQQRIDEILSIVELTHEQHMLVRTFSGGMIRKLEIGQAMLHHPAVLFLDEPTSGLDPMARRTIWKHLREMQKSFGTTIFFSTHYMEEAEEVCSRMAIMQLGNIAAIGSVEELKKATGQLNATLEDTFIYFSGGKMNDQGNYRDIRRARMNEHRLG